MLASGLSEFRINEDATGFGHRTVGHRPTGGLITTPGCATRGKSSEWLGPQEVSGSRVQRCLFAPRVANSSSALELRIVGSGLPEFWGKGTGIVGIMLGQNVNVFLCEGF